MDILVTGSAGFLGKNLVTALRRMPSATIHEMDLGTPLSDVQRIARGGLDIIYHLAGTNRPRTEGEFTTGNVDLTAAVVALAKSSTRATRVVFSSSVQAELDNPYGVSKREAEMLLRRYASETGRAVYVYRLPNLFGKWSRPDYNSVVATFCDRAARGLPLDVHDPSRLVTFAYVDDVVREFLAVLPEDGGGRSTAEVLTVLPDYPITVGLLAERIMSCRDSRINGILPSLEDPLSRYLYATYLSFLPPEGLSRTLDTRRDARGWLAEVVKSHAFGQVFVSETLPGVTRGNHYHDTKAEKFCVVRGEASIVLRRLSDGASAEYRVNGDSPCVVDIPPGFAHSITNTGRDNLMTLFWADEVFDPLRPDTYPGTVQ